MNAPHHLEDFADRVRPRAASSLLLWLIAGFVMIFVVWAGFTRLDRTVRAPGRIVPSSQLQTVANLEGGVIAAILVQAGQIVPAGAPLVRLDQTQSKAEFGTGNAALGAAELKAARLRAEIAGREPVYPAAADPAEIDVQRSLHRARVADLAALSGAASARMMQARQAVGEAEAALAARRTARDSAASQLALIRPLVDKGIEPRLSLIQSESQAAIASSDVAAASAAVARARGAQVEAAASLQQVRQDWRSRAGDELAAADAERAGRRATLPALSDRMARTIVRAPLAGRVNRVLVTTIGGTIRPGEPIVELVPTRDSLLMEAQVAPKDIASVRLGQAARVTVSAYESAVYGFLEGRVIAVSPDAVADPRTGETHYLVRIRTYSDALRDPAGAKLAIGPGMTTEASLLGDRRSVLSYIFTPITRLGERAFRE